MNFVFIYTRKITENWVALQKNLVLKFLCKYIFNNLQQVKVIKFTFNKAKFQSFIFFYFFNCLCVFFDQHLFSIQHLTSWTEKDSNEKTHRILWIAEYRNRNILHNMTVHCLNNIKRHKSKYLFIILLLFLSCLFRSKPKPFFIFMHFKSLPAKFFVQRHKIDFCQQNSSFRLNMSSTPLLG